MIDAPAWNKTLEKTYGTLVAKVGKLAAEQFFPRQSKKVKAEPIAATPAQASPLRTFVAAIPSPESPL